MKYQSLFSGKNINLSSAELAKRNRHTGFYLSVGSSILCISVGSAA